MPNYENNNIPEDSFVVEPDYGIDSVSHFVEPTKRNKKENVPQSIIRTERQLIGALFYIKAHPEIIIGEVILSIRPEWFADEKHRNIMTVLKLMMERGDVIMPTVAVQYSQIKNAYKGENEDFILDDLKKMSFEWLKLLKRQKSQEARILEGLISVIRDRFSLGEFNSLYKKMPQIIKSDKTNKEKLSEIVCVIDNMSESFSMPVVKKQGMDLMDAVANAILFREKVKKGEICDLGMQTGFPELDQVIGGFGLERGKVYSIGGLSGMGKTTFALNVVTNLAKNNYRTMFFSYEMSEADIQYKILGAETSINPKRIQHGELDSQEWGLVSNKAESLGRLPLDYLGYAELKTSDISKLEQRLRKEVEENKVDAVLVDHIALVGYDALKNVKETERITAIARRLSRLAKELNVVMIILCQLNRGAEKRGLSDSDRRPVRSDVKSSGAIWEESDVFMFIHRDGAFKTNSIEDKNKPKYGTIIVGKNRMGEENVDVTVVSELNYSRFTNLSDDHLLPS
jgi:replicative DNA helicase